VPPRWWHQGEQIGLTRNGVDQLNDIADAGRRLRQLADAIVGLAGDENIERLVSLLRRLSFLDCVCETEDRIRKKEFIRDRNRCEVWRDSSRRREG
jgi:hypothetical protein